MNRRSLTSAMVAVALATLVAGCAQPPKTLYMWETFPRQQYDALLGSASSPDSQIQAMEAHAAKASGNGAALPPGFRAHLGMLYLGNGNAQQAERLWLAEKTAFPESAPYVDRLLKRLTVPASTEKTTPGKENPA
jgi:hypothetical protein